jgi:hypothetical protein
MFIQYTRHAQITNTLFKVICYKWGVIKKGIIISPFFFFEERRAIFRFHNCSSRDKQSE